MTREDLHPDSNNPRPDPKVAAASPAVDFEHQQISTKNSEECFRALVETSPEAIFIRSAERFAYVNPAALRLFGAERPEELLGQPIMERFHADCRAEVARRIGLVNQGQAMTFQEYICLRLDGSQVNVEMMAQPFLYANQAGEVVFARDISRRKRAEEALKNSEQRMRVLFEHAPDAYYLNDLNGTFVDGNRAAEEMVGYRREELIGKSFLQLELLDAAGLARATEALARNHQGLPTGPEEFVLKRKDGIRITVEIHTHPVQINGQSLVLGIARDVSERQRTREAQQRLAAAVEQSAESIMITDVNGAMVYVNPAFEKISGYRRKEAVGQNPRLLKSGKHDEAFYAQMWQTLLGGKVWQGDMTNKRKDGALYQEAATISPVRDSAGRIVNYVAVKRDITRERQLEFELRQAQKMQAVGQLAGGVAHDFNNLLLVMRGNADLLLLEADQYSEPAKECLTQITTAAERAASLTRQLLTFSRKQTMQSEPVALSDLVANLAKMVKRIIGENIDLQCENGADLPLVQADAGLMEQVLINLVINARDAMPQGGHLRISLERVSFSESEAQANPETRAGEFVCLTVSDTGCGIAAEHLPRIFEPFFTTKEPGKGTGLGLATVYGIVHQHKGWIKVHSSPGQKTEFRIFLPALGGSGGKVKEQEPAQPVRTGTETILLVEDEDSVRVVTRRVLEAAGYKVHEAGSGQKAMRIWADHAKEIALVLSDVVMPEGMTGRELAKLVRNQKADVKIIFMSGYSADIAGKDTQFFRKADSQFLQKPCSSRVLLERVRTVLDQKSEE